MEAMRKDDYSERIGWFMKLDDERRKVEMLYKEEMIGKKDWDG